MLKSRLIHPELAGALAAAGHGAKVLLADGNYPLSTRTPPDAARVYLNLAPGVVSVTQALEVLLTAIPVEAAEVMVPADGPEPAVFGEFRRLLGGAPDLAPLEREAFYAAASAPDVAVAVATGEGRLYANLLLTIGVVPPEPEPA
jgi:L-fucose mutarotase